MFVKKENIVIRSATNDDSRLLTDWWNDGNVMAHAGFPNGLGTTEEEVNAKIIMNEKSLSQLCISEVGNQRIGECSFRIKDNIAEIGIKICDSTYQNKGLGTLILNMLIHYLFTDTVLNKSMRVNKIILDTNKKNLRAQHVYEKLGFRKIATNMNAWKDQLGEWQASIDYEMTLDDYNKSNN